MKATQYLLISTVATSLFLSGCQTSQEQDGRLIGAIAGGLIGSSLGNRNNRGLGTFAGVVLGSIIGGKIGRGMDKSDRHHANHALEHGQANETSRWHNPDSGRDYAVTPTKTYYRNSQPCREYTTEAWIDGKKQSVYGTACRQNDGSWQARNE